MTASPPTPPRRGWIISPAMMLLLMANTCPGVTCPGERNSSVTASNPAILFPADSTSVRFSSSTGAYVTIATLPPGFSSSELSFTMAALATKYVTIHAAANVQPGQRDFTFSHSVHSEISTRGLGDFSIYVAVPFVLLTTPAVNGRAGETITGTGTLSPHSSYVRPIALSFAGLPPNATATFVKTGSPQSAFTYEIAIPANAVAGTYQAQLTATAGGLVRSAPVLVTVLPSGPGPGFTIQLSQTAVQLQPTASTTLDLIVERTGSPDVGAVAVTLSGLPDSVSASFNPPSITQRNGQLTLTSVGATPGGPVTVTVRGTAGNVTHVATFDLTIVPAPSFTMQVVPSALTIARGASGQATIRIVRTGSPGPVVLSVPNPPTGVTATFNPGSIANADQTSELTLNVGATASPGTHEITVRGVAGSLVQETTLSLVIPSGTLGVVLLTPDVSVVEGGTVLIPVRVQRTGTAIGQLVELRVTTDMPSGYAWVSPTLTTADTATLQVIGGGVGTWNIAVVIAGALIPPGAGRVHVTSSSTPDFSLLPVPRVLPVQRNMFNPVILNIIRSNGFDGPVVFHSFHDSAGDYVVEILPASGTDSFVSMRVYVGTNVPAGPRLLIVRGTSGGIVREAYITLLVQ